PMCPSCPLCLLCPLCSLRCDGRRRLMSPRGAELNMDGAAEGPTMIEAANTNTSTGGIWAIVVVAVICLAFWLTMLAFASQNPGGVRERGRIRMMGELQGPVLGGTPVSDCGRSVSPNRDSPATFSDAEADAVLGPREEPEAVPAGAAPSRAAPDAAVPGQRAPGAT